MVENMVPTPRINSNNVRRITTSENQWLTVNNANRKSSPAISVKKPKSNKNGKYAYIALRISVVCLFMAGFIYQTLQFLLLYWTYPTVVDIQQSSPTYLEIPSFTFCNQVGYFFEALCKNFENNPCANPFFASMMSESVCNQFPHVCINGTKLPTDFTIISWEKFMTKNAIKRSDFPLIAQPLEEYLTCTIEFAGKSTECNMDNVLGSLYTTDDLPQFCYTIYSKWGQPNKTRETIPKGATMKFHLYMNLSRRPENSPLNSQYDGGYAGPWFNPPCDSTVLIAVHSPYYLPSPHIAGSKLLHGHKYELRVKLSESHLMPLPYQTNCTDYMTTWYRRGGKAPINQLGIIQECRINKTYEALGCIPVTMDYPHDYDLCKSCPYNSDTKCKWKEPPNNCSMLADHYNQPCDSMNYEVEKEEKAIVVVTKSNSMWAGNTDALRMTYPAHDCEGAKLWRPECSTIDIEVPFDRFEITNITYNPKYESLELFSVVGGYMGMWLGISLLTVFDLFSDCVTWAKGLLAKQKKKKMRTIKNRLQSKESDTNGRSMMESTAYHVW